MNQDNNLEKKGHEGRDDLAGEHKFGDTGQMVLFVVFLIVWVTDSFVFHYSNQFAGYIPLYLRIVLGAIFILVSLYLFIASHTVIFHKIRETPMVVDKGVFGRVRHPMYLAAILLYLGLICFTISIASIIIWIIILLFYNFIAGYEEKILIEKFGDDYKNYMQRVRRWIPRLRIK